ncbi:Protein of unknown function [Pyronema omphalodes CBS 100304]|uniref:Uncharacterized protein n=1 Tax=Pyronema omphalodes (strain CBS 100304) TaxID=1076935 RepID=U4L0I5_PYROM|nr:Protein of unknown function [Pyronema omphalodes CBS 100304]
MGLRGYVGLRKAESSERVLYLL